VSEEASMFLFFLKRLGVVVTPETDRRQSRSREDTSPFTAARRERRPLLAAAGTAPTTPSAAAAVVVVVVVVAAPS